ncbi:hypothetical protein MFRU_002g03640 [Monilinia fructicola]|uniref:Meiotically up-regulated protein Msb1/Mug8 domain-containing protein n=1 Tax=Monilinia fructicola TaxID=38448 RepID=A0A5M9JZM7_MONFR|nr:hypothetical protein EYC84_004226 [Monilinia fructicola]KAG4035015.1 hypothetical protein MFRU_002g03640 [Monilinia fructicola]
MPSFFSRLKGKDGPTKASKKKGGLDDLTDQLPAKPTWTDAWTRTTVEPEEIQELVRGCTVELKSRALDTPFLLLPFRPTSDPSAARTFIRNFFDKRHLGGEMLAQELRLTEPMVLCSVLKWCWGRLAGGVVSWDAYELFKVGENDSNYARDAFVTFIPLSVDSDARRDIIFDFFDLLSAIAAHGKLNGLAGRKLSRYAGWWAFEQADTGNGFEGGYKGWSTAADAASHLFFAYLRSLSPGSVAGMSGISKLPMSLQKLVQETEYPPEQPSLLQQSTTKVVMIVNSVSPTPFALLRRANHFQYRDDDRALQQFSEYDDPVRALTDECRRVLRSISSTNQSQASSSKDSTGLRDASWSRFEDMGFSASFDDDAADDDTNFLGPRKPKPVEGLRSTPANAGAKSGDRPTTPSWADFLSSGFVDDGPSSPPPLLLPPDKILPPINTRAGSSQSHQPRLESNKDLEPGELASITRFDLDDSFWWVWITSLAGEETVDRKASFGRCALIETTIPGGRWLVMEEMVKGAAPEPEAGAYIAEKKSFWGRTKKNKNSVKRRGSTGKTEAEKANSLKPGYSQSTGASKTTIGPDQHARIQAAAIQLQQRQRKQDEEKGQGVRRGRNDMDEASLKTSSVFTLQPMLKSEASPAMKWATIYDKDAIREAYLGSNITGRGLGEANVQTNGNSYDRQAAISPGLNSNRDLPPTPTTPSGLSSPLPPPPKDEDKAEEVRTPTTPSNTHPLERKPVPVPPSPLNQNKPSLDFPRASLDHSTSNPEYQDKHRKLKKDPPAGAGIRGMFGRKKQTKPAPPNASEVAMNGKGGAKSEGKKNSLTRRFSRKKSPLVSPTSEREDGFISPAPPVSSGERTPATPATPRRPSSEHSVDQDDLSRVDTIDAREARQEFSRFDQGPLEDFPAFAPTAESDTPRASEDSASPPNITRNRREEANEAYQEPLTQQTSPQDRWAQIRKNAAEQAAASRESEEQSRGGYSQQTDNDDGETSGEETIESRVARIKARVAELTGNMENNSAPAPTIRRKAL